MAMIQAFPRSMGRSPLRLSSLRMNSSRNLACLRAEMETQQRLSEISYDRMVKELKSILIKEKSKGKL